MYCSPATFGEYYLISFCVENDCANTDFHFSITIRIETIINTVFLFGFVHGSMYFFID